MKKAMTIAAGALIVLASCTEPVKPDGGTDTDKVVCDLTVTTTTKAGTVCDVTISAITPPPGMP